MKDLSLFFGIMILLSFFIKFLLLFNPTIVLISNRKYRVDYNTYLTYVDGILYFNIGLELHKFDISQRISNKWIEVDEKNIYFKYSDVKYKLVIYPVDVYSFDI